MIISVLGAKGLAQKFGKKGTYSDIQLYNTSSQGKRFTFVEPAMYPQKIQSLLAAAGMSGAAILYITPEVINFQLGEIILVLDYLKKEKGAVLLDGVAWEQIEQFVKGTLVENYLKVNNEKEIWAWLLGIEESKTEGQVQVLVDHSFMVKSVGVVVLAYVTRGILKKYDKLQLEPAGKEVIIKSIQMQDEDQPEAKAGDRVGLALKGAEVEDVPRGTVIGQGMLKGTSFDVSVSKTPFSKEIPSNVMLFTGLQFVNAAFLGQKIQLEKPIVYNEGQRAILCDPSAKIRIIGWATL